MTTMRPELDWLQQEHPHYWAALLARRVGGRVRFEYYSGVVKATRHLSRLGATLMVGQVADAGGVRVIKGSKGLCDPYVEEYGNGASAFTSLLIVMPVYG